jgi:hypothetical protein
MKPHFLLFLSFLLLLSGCGICPTDKMPDLEFTLDNNILRNGTRIIIFDSTSTTEDTLNYPPQNILSHDNKYRFMFIGKSFRIKINFRDSSEIISQITPNKNYNSKFLVKKNTDKLVLTDVTPSRTPIIIKFILYFLLIYLLVKIIPVLLIIAPDRILHFFKVWGGSQFTFAAVLVIFQLTLYDASFLLNIQLSLCFLYFFIDFILLIKIYKKDKGLLRIISAVMLSHILLYTLGSTLIFEYFVRNL